MMNLSTWECEKTALARLAIQCAGDICEIGCWAGDTTRILAQNLVPDCNLVCIDAWNPEGLVAPRYADDFRKAEAIFRELVEGDTRIKVIKQKSAQAAVLLRERKFGLIFVDGGHESEQALSDLIMYWPLLSPSGKLVLHDVFDPYWGPKILRALWAFCRMREAANEPITVEFIWPTPPLAERIARGGEDYELGGLGIISKANS